MSKKLLHPQLPIADINLLRRCFVSKARKNKQKHPIKKGLVNAAERKSHYLQFLGSGANGSVRALYWFCGDKGYIFNVGEGTQRLAHEYVLNFTHTRNVFITYPVWENIGGLLGFVLELSKRGLKTLFIHGPNGLNSLFEATKRFFHPSYIKTIFSSSGDATTYEDHVVHVEYVRITSTKQIRADFTSRSSPSYVIPDMSVLNDVTDYYAHLKKTQTSTFMKNSFMSPNLDSLQVSMAYICKKSSKCGIEYDLAKCVNKGVPPGPLWKQLISGKDITLPNGEIVRVEDVKESDYVFIVLECPTVDFIESLITNKRFAKYQIETDSYFDKVKYVIHFTPSHVMEDDRYQAWMKKFHEHTIHFEANDKNKCSGFVASRTLQHQLNLLDPEVFPELKDDSIPDIKYCWRYYVPGQTAKQYLSLREKIKRKDLNLTKYEGNTLRILNLDGRAVDSKLKDCVYIHREITVCDTLQYRNTEIELQTLKSKLMSIKSYVDRVRRERPFPIITFLGTGSSSATMTRNTAGILVTIEDNNHILLDCGEGTFGQMVGHFGVTRTDEILANTNVIFISHLHSDHHLGLFTLLKKRRDAVKKLGSKCLKAYLLAPHHMQLWLYNYQQRFEEIYDCINFVPNNVIEYRTRKNNETSLYQKLQEVASLQNIVTSYVRHCEHSFGISLTDAKGCKITYSGDSLPSNDLIEIGQNSDLLIHEATYEDALAEKARLYLHSTPFDANEVCRKMNAKFLILTHFCHKYRYIPIIDSNFHERVGIAFDNMEVRMGDLSKLHLFNPVLKTMFENERSISDEFPNFANTSGYGRKTIFGKYEDY